MYRYTLEPYKGPASRYTCPECGRKQTFSRYVDTKTGSHLAAYIGRCSREDKCGYHCKSGKSIVDSPWPMVGKGTLGKSIADSPWTMAEKKNRKHPPPPDHEPSTMDYRLLEKSLTGYTNNIFVNWLVKLFGEDLTAGLIGRYLIGSTKHWPGATVFWQIAADGNIRAGKIMLYGDDGRRVKKPFNHVTWAHSIIAGSKQLTVGSKKEQSAVGDEQLAIGSEKEPQLAANCKPATANFSLTQCFFGEHLLKEEPLMPVAIVESEKSAIIAGVYLPKFIWLAAGSLSNLSAGKCKVLNGRNVTLFPDLNCFDKWQQKATEIGLGFKISALLETNANDADRTAGLDLADYLLKYNYRQFIAQASKPAPAVTENYTVGNVQPILNLFARAFGCDADQVQYRKEQIYNAPVWDDDINKLTAYFTNAALPRKPLLLNNCTVIDDVALFVNNHLEIIKHNNDNRWHNVYLKRLQWLKDFMEAG